MNKEQRASNNISCLERYTVPAIKVLIRRHHWWLASLVYAAMSTKRRLFQIYRYMIFEKQRFKKKHLILFLV